MEILKKLNLSKKTSDHEFKKKKKNIIKYANYLFKKAQKERNVFGVLLLISNQRAQHPTQLICK